MPETAQQPRDEEDVSDLEVSTLDSLIAQATAKYAQKDYKAAAELYSRCAQLQAEQNGELSTKNADLLYSYGRCLYHVAILKSDVLGPKVAGEGREETSQAKETNKAFTGAGSEDNVAEQAVETASAGISEKISTETKPYFQFQGDENFDGSDEEEDGEAEENGEEEDDFSIAFEILDLARILLRRRLEEEQSNEGKGKTIGDSQVTKQLKERLADTHDLQAEISLEGEQFSGAVNDLRAALALKEELYPPYSSLIAETHYKLSLALEFSSVTQQKNESGEVDPASDTHVDEAMREEAAKEMEAAISCCRLRLSREDSVLASDKKALDSESRGLEAMKKSIEDVKEMVQDMEQRLAELRQSPTSINDLTGTSVTDGVTPFSGILSSILGKSTEGQKERLEIASKNAKDVTNLVKRSKASLGSKDSSNNLTNMTTKRKVDSTEENEVGPAKKTRLEEPGK